MDDFKDIFGKENSSDQRVYAILGTRKNFLAWLSLPKSPGVPPSLHPCLPRISLWMIGTGWDDPRHRPQWARKTRWEKRMNETARRASRLMSMSEVADYLAVSEKRLYEWSSAQYGPVPLKVGGTLRYRPADVEAFLDRAAKWEANTAS